MRLSIGNPTIPKGKNMLTDEYVKRVYAQVEKRDGDQPEFLQAVREVFESLEPVVAKHPEYEKAGVLDLPAHDPYESDRYSGILHPGSSAV